MLLLPDPPAQVKKQMSCLPTLGLMDFNSFLMLFSFLFCYVSDCLTSPCPLLLYEIEEQNCWQCFKTLFSVPCHLCKRCLAHASTLASAPVAGRSPKVSPVNLSLTLKEISWRAAWVTKSLSSPLGVKFIREVTLLVIVSVFEPLLATTTEGASEVKPGLRMKLYPHQ
jgi:hypothetical protein